MEELEAVENYLHRGVYPSGLSKGEKANLRRKLGLPTWKINLRISNNLYHAHEEFTDA